MSTKAQVKTQAKTPAAPAAARIPQPPVAEPEREADRPDITAQLEGAARLGHSLGAISVDSYRRPIIQRQETTAEEEDAPQLMPGPAASQRQEIPEEEEEELQLKPGPAAIQRQEIPEEEEEELQLKREPAAVQRQEIPEEEEEELQMKLESAVLQRQELPDEDGMMQPDMPSLGLHGGPVAPDVEAAIQRATGRAESDVRRENRTGLPDNLKLGLENLSGLAMDDVSVHYSSPKPAEIHAHAFTRGKDIHIASGQEKHLPHEGWHVVQQAQGRVKPTMQLKDGVPVNDDQGLEHEADVMGAKALQARRPEHATFAPIAQVTALEAQDRAATEASEVPGATIGASGETRRLNLLFPTNSMYQKKEEEGQGYGFLDKHSKAVEQRRLQSMAELHSPGDTFRVKHNMIGLHETLAPAHPGHHYRSTPLPVQGIFRDPIKRMSYEEIKAHFDQAYDNVPRIWAIKQLAESPDKEYSTLEQVAAALKLRPKVQERGKQPEKQPIEAPKPALKLPKPEAQPVKKEEQVRKLFRRDKFGICYYEQLMGGEKEEPLTRMYTPEGEEIYVNIENMVFGLKDFGWAFEPPMKKKALFAPAIPCELNQGLAQLFTCYECRGLADAGHDCDWVVHDRDAGGCGAANIIAGGDAHSRMNEAFRKAMAGITASTNMDQIRMTLGAHQKAAAFWGFDDLDEIISTPGRWTEVKQNAVYIAEDMAGFVAAVDKIAM
jgi:hypothetical protein